MRPTKRPPEIVYDVMESGRSQYESSSKFFCVAVSIGQRSARL